MGRIAIACYKPKPGQEQALRALVATHVSTLRSIGLATERVPIVMQAADGTMIEVFEWASSDAIAAAHSHPVVGKMWQAFGAVCDYVPIGSVAEATQMFSEFTPVDFQ